MKNQPVIVIAEAGVNHNGSLEAALALVDAAAAAGADVVKFQTFRADALASSSAPKAAYQARLTEPNESQVEMLRRLELSVEAHRAIVAHCAKRSIRFLSSAFDLASLSLLVDELRLDELKLGSGEVTNAPLLLAAARTSCRLILSTGMSSLAEIEQALGVIAFALMNRGNAAPGRAAFARALSEPAAWAALRKRVTLLHCTSEYPAPIADTNLRAMETIRTAFGLTVGYSDHTEGIAISIAAVARGAAVIEKHLTLDRDLPGPDHAASLEPEEFHQLVKAIRTVESAMGNGIKQPTVGELANRIAARKSLITASAIAKGQEFTVENVTVKRPGTGRSPMEYWSTMGIVAERGYAIGEPLDP